MALGISFTDCAILTALLHGWHTSLHAQCHQAHISVSASVRKAACQRQCAQTCMHIICFKLVALGISFTDCAILTALLHGWHTSLHAQCHQAHISVSASVRKAACQRQCAQTCMHIICFKLVALGISFTDGAILTALLHGWHTSLHAQCHQGHISVSASVRKAACQRQCAQTCMHIICFKLVALGISFTDCAILTALLHGWHTSTACTMSPGSRLSICLSAQSSLSAAMCSDMHAHHLLQASGTGDQFHRLCHTDCTAAWLAYITACTMSPGSHLSICLSAQSSLSAAMCSDMHAHHLLQASGTGDQFHRLCHTDCTAAWLAHITACTMSPGSHLSICLSAQSSLSAAMCSDMHAHHLLQASGTGDQFHRLCHTDCTAAWLAYITACTMSPGSHLSICLSAQSSLSAAMCSDMHAHHLLQASGTGDQFHRLCHTDCTAAWLAHITACTMSPGSRLSICLSAQSSLSAAICSDMHAHHLLQASGTGDQFHRLCHTDCTAAWLAHITACTMSPGSHLSICLSAQSSLSAAMCSDMHAHHLLQASGTGDQFHRLCHTDCTAAWLAHITACTMSPGSHLSICLSAQSSLSAAMCSDMHAHHLLQASGTGDQFHRLCHTDCTAAWLAHITACTMSPGSRLSICLSAQSSLSAAICSDMHAHHLLQASGTGDQFHRLCHTDCTAAWLAYITACTMSPGSHLSICLSAQSSLSAAMCSDMHAHHLLQASGTGDQFTDGAILTALVGTVGPHQLHAQCHQAHVSVSASVRKAACQRQYAQTCMHIICFKLVALGISFTDFAILTALLHGWHTSLHAQCHQAHVSVSASVRKAACQRQYAQTCMHIICFKLVALGISFTDFAILTALLHGWHTSLHAQCHQAHVSVSASVRKAACQRQCAQTCMHIICFKLVALGISFTDCAILTALLHGWHTSLHAQCHQGHISASASVRKAACQWQCAQTCMHIICFKLVALGISFTDCAILTALLHGWHTSLHAQCHQAHISVSASVRKAACQRQCAQTCMHIICFKLVALGISFTDGAILTALLHGWHTSLHAQCHQGHISASASVRKAACQRQCAQTCMHIICFKLVALGISFTDCAILTALLHGWHTSLHAQCHQAHISVSASVRKAACQRQCAQTCMHIICFKLVALGISFTDCAILTALLHGWHTSLHAQCHQAHISVSASVRKAACQRQCAQTCMHIICFKLVALGISFTDCAILTALLHGWHTDTALTAWFTTSQYLPQCAKQQCQRQCAQTCMHIICFKLVALGISFTDCAILTALSAAITACTMSPGSHLSICLSAQSSMSAAIAQTCMHIICFKLVALGISFTDCAILTALLHGWHTSLHAQCHQAHISASASVRKAACQRQCAQTCMHIICFKLVALGISFTDCAILTALLHGWHTSLHAQCHQAHISASASVRKAACQRQCAQTCMHIICFKLVALGISFTDCAILTALLHGWHTSLHAQCHQAHISVSASVRKAACQRQCAQTCMHIICFKLVALGISSQMVPY